MSIVSSIRANGEPLLCGPPTSIKPSQNSASVSYTLDENEFNQRTALLFQPLNPALRFLDSSPLIFDLEPNDLPESEATVRGPTDPHDLRRYDTTSPGGGIIPDK